MITILFAISFVLGPIQLLTWTKLFDVRFTPIQGGKLENNINFFIFMLALLFQTFYWYHYFKL
jgi:hypothetical protein